VVMNFRPDGILPRKKREKMIVKKVKEEVQA